jgi:2-(1,2-epoxy-1,2-dihydrophenyl)acetyl-CoA isomerase
MTEEHPVRAAIEGPVATLTIDRPDRHNGMNAAMVVAMYDALWELRSRHDVRIVVLTGSGDRFFSPGADLEGGASGERLPDHRYFQVSAMLHDMPQVTLAAINGSVAGAGLSWACGCDLRVASASARFSTAFLDVGVAGDFGLPWSLSRIVGPARARELFMLTGRFGADRALELGLVSALHDPGSFRDEVAATVRRLADAAPTALRALKANFVASEHMGFADYLEVETERHLRLVAGPEFREGSLAFAEHRRPRFG